MSPSFSIHPLNYYWVENNFLSRAQFSILKKIAKRLIQMKQCSSESVIYACILLPTVKTLFPQYTVLREVMTVYSMYIVRMFRAPLLTNVLLY